MQKMILPLLFLAFFIFIGGCQSVKPSWPVEPGQYALQFTGAQDYTYNYLLHLPADYGKGKKKWPLMLFLHGAGERGDDVKVLEVHGPPKLAAQGKDLPFIIVSPQCPTGQWWTARTESLMALVDEMIARYNVDETRVYVTGLSMGGFGTWQLASQYPDRFAAAIPICGGGNAFLARTLKTVPIWAFHGGKDSVVPLSGSETLVEAVNKEGGDAKLTVYPEAGHDSWTVTYENDEIYKWLLSHHK